MVFLAIQHHLQLSFFHLHHHRLRAQPPDHVERILRLAAQRQFQQVLLQALFHRLAHLLLHGEVPVGGHQTIQRLVRPLVVVVFHPQRHALPRRFEAVELGPHQELLPDSPPEPLDLAQRHRMVRGAADMMDAVLGQLLLEARLAVPAGVLPPVVREHLLGNAMLADRRAVHLHDVLARLAPEQAQADDIAGVVVDEPDQVGVPPIQPEAEDVRLPHLVRRCPLEEPRLGRVLLHPARLGLGQHLVLMQCPAHRLRTGRQEQSPPQPMRDPPHPVAGMLLLHRHDLLLHQRRQLGLGRFARLAKRSFQTCPAVLLILSNPTPDAVRTGPDFLRHQLQVEAFLQMQLHRPKPDLRRIPGTFWPARRPPRGALGLLPLPRFLRLHGNTPFLRKCHPFSPSIWSHSLVARTIFRDGSQRMWISPIVRPKAGGVALGDALEMGETAEGRFASLF